MHVLMQFSILLVACQLSWFYVRSRCLCSLSSNLEATFKPDFNIKLLCHSTGKGGREWLAPCCCVFLSSWFCASILCVIILNLPMCKDLFHLLFWIWFWDQYDTQARYILNGTIRLVDDNRFVVDLLSPCMVLLQPGQAYVAISSGLSVQCEDTHSYLRW